MISVENLTKIHFFILFSSSCYLHKEMKFNTIWPNEFLVYALLFRDFDHDSIVIY